MVWLASIGKWVLKNWRLLLILALALTVYLWGQARYSAGYTAAEAKAKELHDQALAKVQADHIKELTAKQDQTYEISKDYQAQLADIRARPSGNVIWMRLPAPSMPGEATGAPTSGSDGTPIQTVPEATGRDIGPELYELVDIADAQAAQLASLQNWVETVCLSPRANGELKQ